MSWKGCGRRRLWPILMHNIRIIFEKPVCRPRIKPVNSKVSDRIAFYTS
jgi:hypothetical protein